MNDYYLQQINKLRLFDDDFMKIVFKDDRQCVKEVIDIICQSDNDIQKVFVEDYLKNIVGKDFIFDIVAITPETSINLEIQRDKYRAKPIRAKNHEALLISYNTKPQQNDEEQVKTMVIFLIEEDYYGLGEPIYHIERIVKETGESFADGSMILYVNGEYEGQDALGSLMKDFKQSDYRLIENKILKEKVRMLKETKEGREKMCLIFEEIRNKGIEEGQIAGRKEGIKVGRKEGIKVGKKNGRKTGRKEGRQQERVKNLKSLMNNCQMNLEEAMNALNISEAERDDYRKQLNH